MYPSEQFHDILTGKTHRNEILLLFFEIQQFVDEPVDLSYIVLYACETVVDRWRNVAFLQDGFQVALDQSDGCPEFVGYVSEKTEFRLVEFLYLIPFPFFHLERGA